MAISKILHMKDSGNSFHARHLKRALDYVMNPEKTQGGRLVGAINCQADMAFEQMMDTKKQFGKTDKRQGYHIILSFKEDEVEPDRAFKITQKFVAEYLGDAYEAVFVVHDNTDHVHSHIVFNSVRKDSKIFLTRLNRSGSLMMRNRVIRVGIPSLKMSTMHGKGLTQSF